MKITQIKAIPLVRSLPEPFLGGTYRITSRNTLVTEVHTDTGIVGQVFGGDEDKYQQEIAAVIETRLAPLLIGEDPRDVEKHWERMFRADPGLENRGLHTLDLANKAILMQAISAVDIACGTSSAKPFRRPCTNFSGVIAPKSPSSASADTTARAREIVN